LQTFSVGPSVQIIGSWEAY